MLCSRCRVLLATFLAKVSSNNSRHRQMLPIVCTRFELTTPVPAQRSTRRGAKHGAGANGVECVENDPLSLQFLTR